MNHLERWTANESLLQSYRSIFISSQSFFLTAGAVLIEKSPFLVFSVAAMALVMIWFIWLPVVKARFLIVDYHKYLSMKAQLELPGVCSERDYVHDEAKRQAFNNTFGIDTNWRATRIKLDLALPILFTVFWVVLVIHQITC